MAKSTVPVNFKDDIMNSAMGGKRRYRMINNSDGTISLEDVTTYDQVGSTFGAAQLNATNTAVNAAADASKIIDDIDAIRALTQEGYIAGARALKQVDNSLEQIINSSDFGFVEGICASSDNTYVFCDYPSGFNANNSMVVSAGFYHSGEWYYNNIHSITPRVLLGDKIKVENSATNAIWYGKPFRVLLRKIS